MRDIKFRGKKKYDGKWIYGYLFNNGYDGEEERFFIGYIIIDGYTGTADDDWDITGIDFAEIIPETVCQYTGLKDKDGQEIWENDIVYRTSLDCDNNTKQEVGIICYHEYNTSFEIKQFNPIRYYFTGVFNNGNIEVIGNIFDNPELLEDSNDKNN